MIAKYRGRTAMAVVCAAMLLVCGTAARAQQAWTLNQAFAFNGSDGAVPLNDDLLIVGTQVYGETYAGGADDLGAIYSYSTTGGSPTLLYSFTGPEGSHPSGGLARDTLGNLYGTTPTGGANNLGTVFKLSPTGHFTTLHSFAQTDGANPLNGVALGPNDVLYGGTYTGGARGASGVIFKLGTSGTGFQVMQSLYLTPGIRTNVVVDPMGNVIGASTGNAEARGGGMLYKVAPNGAFSIVALFIISEGSAPSTADPIGHLARDSAGNVYGVLGSIVLNDEHGSPQTAGTGVYEVTAVTHQLSIRAFFPGQTIQSGVIYDAAGNLYGATVGGGAIGAGSVFKISPTNQLTTIASMPVGNIAPAGALAIDATGKLWGTSSSGGEACGSSASAAPVGCGTLFSLTPP